jgi:putative membrane protein
MRGSLARNPAIGAAWLASLLLLGCGNNNDRGGAGDQTAGEARTPADTFGAGGPDTAGYTGTGTDTLSGGAVTGADTANPSSAIGADTATPQPAQPRSTARARRRAAAADTSPSYQADTSTMAYGQQGQADTAAVAGQDHKLADTAGWNQRNQGDTAAFQQQDTTQGGVTSNWEQQQDTTAMNQADTTAWGQQDTSAMGQQQDTSAWAQQDTTAMGQQDTTAYGQQDTTAYGQQDTTAMNQNAWDSSAAQRSSLTNQTTVDSTRPVTADSVAVSGDTSMAGQNAWADTSAAGQQNAFPSPDSMGMGAGGVAGITADSLRRLGWVRAEECGCQNQQGQQGSDTTQSGWRGADSTAWGNQGNQQADSAQQQGYQPNSWADTSAAANPSAGGWADTTSAAPSANAWQDTTSGAQDTVQPKTGWSQDTTRKSMQDTLSGQGVGAGADSSLLGGLDANTLTSSNLAYLLDEANVADSSAGAVAYGKATDDGVKRFAKMMMTEHGALRKDARAHLQRVGVNAEAPPTDPLKQMAEQGTRTLESTPKGRQFDQAYIDNEVVVHQAVLELIRQGRSASRDVATIEPILEKAEPVIQKHLDMARELQRKVGRPGTSDGAPQPDSSSNQ